MWPIVLLIIGWLVSRLSRNDERRLTVQRASGAVAAVLLCAATLWWGFKQSDSDPVTAYFSTFTRGWELGAGALLACAAPQLYRQNRWLLTAASWVGMALIGVSLFTVTGGSGFPVPGGILPVIGSMLVVGATGRDVRAFNVVLTNRLARHIGDVSYSVYLVHFPVIILVGVEMPGRGAYYYVAAVALTLGIAELSYAVIEQTIVRSSVLLASDDKQKERDPWRFERFAALGGLAALVAGFAVYASWPGTQSADAKKLDALNSSLNSEPIPAGALSPEQKALTSQIHSALIASSWPDLRPSLDETLAQPQAPADVIACAGITMKPAAQCTWGRASATHHVMLVGDSVSMVYVEAFRKIVKAMPTWDVRFVGAAGCEFTSVTMLNADKSIQSACAERNAKAVAAIRAARPDLVVVSNSAQIHTLPNGSAITDAQWVTNLRSEIAKVSASAERVAILEAPPAGGDITTCNERQSPVSCTATTPTSWLNRRDAEKTAGQTVVDSEPWFCVSGECPAFVGTTVTMRDRTHPAVDYLDKIWPVMLEAMMRSKLLG